jgi:predicted TIM-barrel fold metal-dependent hydrolase
LDKNPLLDRRDEAQAWRIDTHHHLLPSFYREWLAKLGVFEAGGVAIPAWSPEDSLAFMDSAGVQTAILSLTTPGVEPGVGLNRAGQAMARQINEYAADVVRDHPGRFGFLATLTLADVDWSLEELSYALDTLRADGVVLLANTKGVYLGDSAFDDLMAELDRRSTVILVHPTELDAPLVPGIPSSVADFLLDTTRTAANLVRTGAMERYSRLKVILSHAGGFVPYAAARMAPEITGTVDYEPGIEALRAFYFDVAVSSARYTLPSLTAFARPERILFGSDFPYVSAERFAWWAEELNEYRDISHADVGRGNAEELFPRFALSAAPA